MIWLDFRFINEYRRAGEETCRLSVNFSKKNSSSLPISVFEWLLVWTRKLQIRTCSKKNGKLIKAIKSYAIIVYNWNTLLEILCKQRQEVISHTHGWSHPCQRQFCSPSLCHIFQKTPSILSPRSETWNISYKPEGNSNEQCMMNYKKDNK